MSKSELYELRDASRQTTAEREEFLRQLDTHLETLDKERAAKIDAAMVDYNKQIRKLKFLPPDIVTRLLQVFNMPYRLIFNRMNAQLLIYVCLKTETQLFNTYQPSDP